MAAAANITAAIAMHGHCYPFEDFGMPINLVPLTQRR